MGNFKSFGKKKFGGRNFAGPKREHAEREEGKPTMHKATCHECGRECEVPFRPNGSRPIFCSRCFDKQGGPSSEKFADKSYGKPRFGGDKRKHEFDRDNALFENKSAEQLKAQFAQLHAKLDKILQALDTRVLGKIEESASEEPAEKPPFKMKKKVSSIKKATKKK